LKQAIISENDIEEKDKLNLVADLESMKEQLVKDHPDKTILGILWKNIQRMGVKPGLVEVIDKVSSLITNLL